MRFVFLVLFAGLFSGCMDSESTCPETASGKFAAPRLDGDYLQTDPRQAWQSLVVADGNLSFDWTAPAGGSMAIQAASPGAALHIATVQPGEDGGAVNVTVEQSRGTNGCATSHGLAWDLAVPVEGDFAQEGQGVHVMTAGFWENGTLFYTNIPEIDGDPAWPKASWYIWESGGPLPVYIHDDDEAVQPIAWGGLGYFTTIPGFNDALKGLSTTTSRVVHLAPEEAFTQAGEEEDPLYGESVVFYIKVVDVVDLPCPSVTQPVECRVHAP